MTKTPNLGLNLPLFDSAPWHDDMYENFRILDAVVFSAIGLADLKGTYKNNTAISVGDRYVDTITGQIFEAAIEYTTPAAPTTFAEDRAANPGFWLTLERDTVLEALNLITQAQQDALAARDEAVAAKDLAVPAKNDAVLAKDSAVAASSTASVYAGAASTSAGQAAASAAAAAASASSVPKPKGLWVTGTVYAEGNIVRSPVGYVPAGSYIVPTGQAHTAGTFATDVSNGKMIAYALDGPTGPGSGDMSKSDNLSGLTNLVTAQANLGITTKLLPVGIYGVFGVSTPPLNWLELNGSSFLIASYTELAAAMYCGDSLNATVECYYKHTNPANPNGSRSTSGTYMLLEDIRGQFIRGWDHGAGVDSGRLLNTYQADGVRAHAHALVMNAVAGHGHGVNDPTHAHGYLDSSGQGNATPVGLNYSGGGSPMTYRIATTNGAGTGISIQTGGAHTPTGTVQSTGISENRVKNVSKMICIYTGK